MDKLGNNGLLYDQNEYNAVDYFRVICALLIISIHLPIFISLSTTLSYFFNHVICRIAVPFFFITSGYFVAEKVNDNKGYKYVKRILIIYVFYTTIYIPQYLYRTLPEQIDIYYIVDTLRRFLLVGSYTQLWYLIALAFAVLALKLMISKLKFNDKTLIVLSILLYSVGVIGNSYKEILLSLEVDAVTYYYMIFSTMRNGLFFGIPFVSTGYLIKKNSYQIRNIGYMKWTILFFIGMLAEAIVIFNYFSGGEKDMMFFTLPTTICFFLMVCFIELKNEKLCLIAKTCRKYSVTIFGLHLFVYFYLNGILSRCGFMMDHYSILRYIIVLIATVILSTIVIKLSEYRPFRWLKYMY